MSKPSPIYDQICKQSPHFVATCLHHSCDLISFFARHGITCARGTSLFGRNITTCSAQYTVSEFLAGTVDINAVVRQYCRNTETKDQTRMYQFMRDLIVCMTETVDMYFIKRRTDELCDIINFLAVNWCMFPFIACSLLFLSVSCIFLFITLYYVYDLIINNK